MSTPALFVPIRFRGVTFRNRLWVAPMTMFTAEDRDGMPSSFHHVHVAGLALSGAGAVIVENAAVAPGGRVTPQDIGLWNDDQWDAWRPTTAFAREYGARIGIQLGHGGRKASTARSWEPQAGTLPESAGGWQPVGPSAVPYAGYATPRALAADEIPGTVDAFVAAALRARDAGFEFVEFHAAHGFLLHQFLSPLANTRRDDWGGSLANRARLLLAVIRRTRAAVGDAFPLFVRVSATDWTPDGWDEDDTAIVTRWAVDAGADFFDVSTGGMVPDATIPVFPGYQVGFAERLRDATGVPVGAVGLITTPQQAEEIVAGGHADVALVGREFLRDPRFGLRAAVALGADIDYHPLPYHRAKHRLEASLTSV
ncbi:NADH:flavin oxidoreductase/NADH oxidase [Curtobacterium sp. MCBD17_019]|uniref:NADH:flavin oxidoreductase/NADH oxidase n=1 Tax=Curtobacterium sp. MCBD17_019 TaxID=2175669 RepID=UPI000DA72EF8|nr:NADH:flavin oxidoreductase/NADH oxidase [Curtobacterium sp. MCBD17_019]PZE76596.1 oxidoreductase [Curtobacterium sp. MCBD17_019]